MRVGTIALLAILLVGCREASLTNDSLRRAVQAMESGGPLPEGVEAQGERIRVEVHLDATEEEGIALVESLGGAVEGALDGVVQALVPYQSLEGLEARDEVRFIRPPPRVDVPAEGERDG